MKNILITFMILFIMTSMTAAASFAAGADVTIWTLDYNNDWVTSDLIEVEDSSGVFVKTCENTKGCTLNDVPFDNYTIHVFDKTHEPYVGWRPVTKSTQSFTIHLYEDLTSPEVNLTPSETDWTINPVTIDIDVTDNVLIDEVRYRINSGSWNVIDSDIDNDVYSDTITITAQGESTVEVRAIDYNNNYETQSVVTKIDDSVVTDLNIDPLEAYTSEGGTLVANDTWQDDNSLYFEWTDVTSGSGIKYHYTTDGSDPSTSDSFTTDNGVSVVFDSDGTHLFKARAINGAGIEGNIETFIVKLDREVPTCSLTYGPVSSPDGNNDWFLQNINVAIACSDAGSSMASREYNLNSTGWNTYTFPVSVTGEGVNTFEWRATDEAGNEASGSEDVKIDKTDPFHNLNVFTPIRSSGWYTQNVFFEINNIQDLESGVYKTYFNYNNQPWSEYLGGTYTMTESGITTLYIRTEDNSGRLNVSSHNFMIDQDVPTLDVIKTYWIPEQNGWTKDNVGITANANDALSGLDTVEYTINGDMFTGPWTTYTSLFNVTGEGIHNVTVRANDTAGSGYISKTLHDIRIDMTAPTIEIAGAPSSWTNTSVWANLNSTDALSGIWIKRLAGFSSDPGTCPTYLSSYPINDPTEIMGHVWICGMSVDLANNENFTEPVEFLVDMTEPDVGITINGEVGVGFEADWMTHANITIINADADSGIDTVEYNLDNAGWVPYTGIITVNSDGYHNITGRAKDNAGNIKETALEEFNIDNSIPTLDNLKAYTDASGSEVANATWQTDNTLYFNWTSTNGPSGLRFYYTTDGSKPDETDSYVENNFVELPFGDGITEFKVRAINGAGSRGTTHTFVVQVDTAEPMIFAAEEEVNLGYIPGEAYDFAVNVTDAGIGIDQVWVVFDGVTYSPDQNGDRFNVTVNDLAAGSYNYQWFANDTLGHSAASTIYTYDISKASPELHLELNGAEADTTVTYPFVSNATAWTNIPGLTYVLERNSTDVGSFSEVAQLGAGMYVYNFSTAGNENYTAQNVARLLTVNKGSVAGLIHLDLDTVLDADNFYMYEDTVNALAYKDIVEGSLELYRNGSLLPGLSESVVLGAGINTYRVRFPETANYSEHSIEYDAIVNKKPINLHLEIEDSENDFVSNHPTQVNITAWKGSTLNNEGIITLYENGADVGSLSKVWTPNPGVYIYKVNLTAENYTAADESWTASINKVTPLLNLYFNGIEGNATYSELETANVTAVLSISKNVTLYINGTEVTNGTSPLEYNWTLLGKSYGKYNVTAVYEGDVNYNRISKTFWIDVTPVPSPIITIISPQNTTYLDTTVLELNYTTNSVVDSVWYSLNGAANVTLLGNTTITVPINQTSYLVLYANSTAGNETSEDVYFTTENTDNIPPYIRSIRNITEMYAGQNVTFEINVTDNVGVANVTIDGILAQFMGNDTWTGNYTINATDGVYTILFKAFDINGNTANTTATLVVNTSADPNVSIDYAPFLGEIYPLETETGVATLFSVNGTDDFGITECYLYINDIDNGLMTGNYPATALLANMTKMFNTPGLYKVYAVCKDTAGHTSIGPVSYIEVTGDAMIPSSGGPGGAGGGGSGSGTTTKVWNLDLSVVPKTATPSLGEVATYTATVSNTGNQNITVSLTVNGVPAEWISLSENSMFLIRGESKTVTIMVNVPEGQSGTYTLTVTAAAGAVSRTANVDLILPSAAPPTNVSENITNVTPPTPTPEPAPSGISGLILGITDNPTILGLIILLVLLAAVGYLYFKHPDKLKKVTKALKLPKAKTEELKGNGKSASKNGKKDPGYTVTYG